uniref:Rx N-terminal domain-containing protein n=1 Tax=Fagus sylvatica TaxID=28930 RepID=A0A2N9FC35_FAGSY
MAEGALNKVAEGVIGQLGNLVVQEIGLLWGAKDDLEKLQKTVSAIKAVLLDAEEKQVQSHAIKDWVENLKDALYEADDVLDNFSTESLRREQMTRNKKAKKVRIFFSKSNQLAYGLKMAHNIKAIREKLDAINANRMEFHLVERVVETQVRSRMRETHYFVRADDVIGREDDKKVILKRLLDSNIEENVSILPIVGIGGLGKTTLAQLVFNHEEIQKHFEKKLWVCISDDFDVRIIVEKILECAKDLNHTGISNVPYSIGKLKHLRYLDLSHNKNIKMLPNSITRLHNLQTLKLSWCRALKELPRDFYKLVNLRHLVIDCCFNLSHMPRGLEQLTNLQTLSNFVLSKKSDSVSGLTRVLKELHGLRGDLEILDLRHGKDGALEPNILKEKHLQNLTLFWLIEDVDEADVGYDEMSLEALLPHPNLKRLCIRNNGGGTFPSWLPSLTNLVRLVLINQKKWQHLPSLVSFPSLKYIYLESLDSLENISEMEWQSLSRLSSLILITLPNLVSIPVGIQHITTLQSLCIMDCPISLERCKRETGEDWPKIAHIPSLEGDLYGL